MTMQSTATPSVVGKAFVEQYYHILHNSPEVVSRFYQDVSVLSRQDPTGVMTSVTTMKDINDKILSLDSKNYKTEIKTADAQESFKDGVIVLVTGCLTGKDNLKRKFAQTFFLAPQDKGYFVLNDVFRYVEENELHSNLSTVVINGTEDTSSPEEVVEGFVLVPNGENENENENGVIVEEEEEYFISDIQEDVQKKSYASILSSQTKKQSNKPGHEVLANINTNEVEDNNEVEDGYPIHIRNLPLNITPTELEGEFIKYGLIKPGGVQVRSNKEQGFCFGFVEFREINSMNNAIQASPVTIGDFKAVVEIKRTTTKFGNDRGRNSFGRGGYQNDGFRGRDGFNGGDGGGGRGRSGRRNGGSALVQNVVSE